MANILAYSTFAESPVAGLEPELFWKYFYEISKIPRPSGSEKAIGDYIVSVAEKHKVPYKRDEAGNVVISKAGSPGHEKSPIVILQSHLDMVCEKNRDIAFDFSKDAIRLKKKGDYITAEGTSLGADNSAGISASLAVLESQELVHPPLELLFTTDEETGMTGAKNLKGDFLKGRRLLNLDSEDEGEIYVGCAGGSDNILRMPVKRIAPKMSGISLKIKVEGLKGGHSGLDIHEGRANAIKLLGRFLWNAKDEIDFCIMNISGGSKRNAIPREAEAIVFLDEENEKKLIEIANKWQKIFSDEYTPVEEHLRLGIEKVEGIRRNKVFSKESTQTLLDLIYLIPHGVLSMSRTIKDLVETSTNLAIIKEDRGEIVFELSHRSSLGTAKESINQRTAALARLCGLKHEVGAAYPGWQPNMNSELLQIAKKTYYDLYHKAVGIKAVHAGLECGLIGEKFPGMDMISFGPTLKNVHSPDEIIYIPSVNLFWKFLVHLLAALA